MLKLFILTVSIGYTLGAVQYLCKTGDLCKYSEFDHITCGATGSKSPSCSSDAFVPFALSSEVKQRYVDLHNEFRNKIASGGQSGYPSAAKMSTVEWDDSLAEYAALNVLRCEYKHDCHETNEFPNAGQNIYAYLDYSDDMMFMANKSVPSWYSEYEQSSAAEIEKCCPNLKNTGHFTQMVADRSNKIGCAAGRFVDAVNGKMTYVVCNYSVTNLFDINIYTAGAPASKCQTGNNPKYPALCSTSEKVDPINIS